MELTQLETFERVARVGNFTRAADKLGLTQPAVSQRIALLEQELKEKLFRRTGRELELTDIGKLFLPYVERILAVQADGLQAIKHYNTGQIGQVSIVSLDMMAISMLKEPLKLLRNHLPTIDCIIRVRNSREIFELLYDGSVSLALLSGPVWAQGLQIHGRFQEPVRAVSSPRHPLSLKKQPLRLSDMYEHTLYRVTLDSSGTELIENLAEQARPGSSGTILWLPAIMAIQMVVEGEGIAVLPETYVDESIKNGDLVYLDIIDLPTMIHQPTLVSLKGANISFPTTTFIKYIRTHWSHYLVE